MYVDSDECSNSLYLESCPKRAKLILTEATYQLAGVVTCIIEDIRV
jgi:hypothetical protein